MEKRITYLFCFMLAVCAGLIGRIVVIDTHQDYITAAEHHSSYKLTLAETRGKIYDRNGAALAGGASKLKALIIPSPDVSARLSGKLSSEKLHSIENSLKGIYPFVTEVEDGSCECEGVTVYRVPQRYADHSLAEFYTDMSLGQFTFTPARETSAFGGENRNAADKANDGVIHVTLDLPHDDWRLEFPDEMRTEMMKQRHITAVNTFLAAIGDGQIDVNEIKDYILKEEERHRKAVEAAQSQDTARPHAQGLSSGKDDILVLNAKDLKGLDYRMARCCNPVFGDDVFGFVTRDAGIKIHRITCPNAARLLELYPYRVQKVRWADTPSSGSFQVALKLITEMEGPVLNKVMEVVGNFKVSLRSFNVTENRRSGTYEISLKLSVPSNLELDKVLSQLRAARGVIKVARL